MQQENLDLSALLHDISNVFKGTSLILNQLIEGAYGYSLEEIRPLLLAALETNNKGANWVEARTSLFLAVNPLMVCEFDMLDFLQKKCMEFEPIVKSYSLIFHYETSLSYRHGTQVRADAASIARMVDNLLQNAIKYTSSGDIFLRLLNLGDDLVVELEDTGVGIADDQISNIFLPFWRSPSNSVAGMGLGMYIVSCVAHAHKLNMTVDSVVGQGTKFTIVFPYKDNDIYGLNGSQKPPGFSRGLFQAHI